MNNKIYLLLSGYQREPAYLESLVKFCSEKKGLNSEELIKELRKSQNKGDIRRFFTKYFDDLVALAP